MSYNLQKDNEIKELTYFSYHFKGLTIKTKNHGRKNMITVNKMTLTDPEIISDYVNNKLDRKFKKLVQLTYEMLSTEGETSDDVTNILSEIDRLKSIIENKYKYYLNVLEYERFLKKIMIIEKELKEKLIELEIQKYYYGFEEQKQTNEKLR